MPSQPRIAIVGGSLVGPALALFLQRYGLDATVIEAAPSKISRAGGVIGLGHVALTALERAGVPQEDYVTVTNQNVMVRKVEDHRVVSETPATYVGRTATWNALNQALLAKLARPVVTGHRVTNLTTLGAEIELHDRRGPFEMADVVVFADGRNSTGRQLTDPTRKLHYANYVAYRGMASHWPAQLGRQFVRMEPRGTQFTTFPMDGFTALDWTFYVDTSTEKFTDMFGRPPTERLFMLPDQINERVRRYVDEWAARLLPATEAAVVHETDTRMAAPIMDIDKPDRMLSEINGKPVILLGDALAPVRPHTARGTNNGIEQADDLAAVLYQVAQYGADLEASLLDWQDRHLPRVRHDIDLGPEFGRKLGLGQQAG